MLSESERELLASFHFTASQRQEVWEAWNENAAGVEACAIRARAHGQRFGNTGAGLLLTMLRRRDHDLALEECRASYTGYRFVRGSHSGTYVRDPLGRDPLPQGYAF